MMGPSSQGTVPLRSSDEGALDGVTLFRFAHMSRRETAGGVERYLGDLNRRLVERNRVQIVQLYLAPMDGRPSEVIEEQIGRGRLIWVPSVADQVVPATTAAEKLMQRIRRRVWRQSLVRHDFLLRYLGSMNVTLAAFHWLSDDSDIVLEHFRSRSTPYVVVNHFQNSRLSDPVVSRRIAGAASVAGVSMVDVPAGLTERFVNVSDGVDAEFFDPTKARALAQAVPGPLLLLPSRVGAGKGHLDAIHLLAHLLRMGMPATLAFAGLIVDKNLVRAAVDAARASGCSDRVLFLGELSTEALRDWYRASAIVLLTTESEGLGRVLLEAQAMETPVVAYDVGGVSEAIAHGETGYLVPLGRTEILANRVSELLGDAQLRARMGGRGRQRMISEFSLDGLAERHERFYSEALRSGTDRTVS